MVTMRTKNLRNVLKDVLAAAGVLRKLLRNTQNNSGLSAHVLYVVIVALIGKLSQTHALACEVLVQIKQIQGGGRRLPQNGRENGGLQRRQRRLKLRGNQAQRLMLDA